MLLYANGCCKITRSDFFCMYSMHTKACFRDQSKSGTASQFAVATPTKQSWSVIYSLHCYSETRLTLLSRKKAWEGKRDEQTHGSIELSTLCSIFFPCLGTAGTVWSTLDLIITQWPPGPPPLTWHVSSRVSDTVTWIVQEFQLARWGMHDLRRLARPMLGFFDKTDGAFAWNHTESCKKDQSKVLCI